MKFETTDIPGVLSITSDCHDDMRGAFLRIHSREEFVSRGLSAVPEQCSLSYNRKRGTVRGLHYQLTPYNEAKLVVCVTGSMFDAIVDLRKSSPTFGRAIGIPLAACGNNAVYVPEGCAHGFQTLENDTSLLYMISTVYRASEARGIRWDDPALDLAWPIRDGVLLSDRDKAFPPFSQLDTYF